MAQLLNQSRGNVAIATSVEVANSFYTRLMGLMFKPALISAAAQFLYRFSKSTFTAKAGLLAL